jgi:hypothetical protein
MAEQKIYEPVHKLYLDGNCRVTLTPQRYHLRQWINWKPRVSLEESVKGYKAVHNPDKRILTLENYEGNLYLPYRRHFTIVDNKGENSIDGKLYCGKIVKNGCQVEVPFSMEKLRGYDTIKHLLQDAAGISLICVAALPIYGMLGLDPLNYLNATGVASAAIWAAIRGDKQTLIESTLFAFGLTFGPELAQGAEGLKNLGLEDILKTGLYLGSLPIGSQVRRFIQEQLD